MRFDPDDCVDFWFVSTIQPFSHSVYQPLNPSVSLWTSVLSPCSLCYLNTIPSEE